MESTPKKPTNKKAPALILVMAAIVVMVYVIWRLDSAPSTNDAYVYADTIDVVPEVSGRIVDMAVHDNQRVKNCLLYTSPSPRD